KANPDGKRVERAGINIIPLPGLYWRRIEIQYQSDAGKEEEDDHRRETLRVFRILEKQPHKSKNQRNHEEVVAAFIARQPFGNLFEGVERREPPGVLHVAFASRKIPHEITHIHVPDLPLEH